MLCFCFELEGFFVLSLTALVCDELDTLFGFESDGSFVFCAKPDGGLLSRGQCLLVC